MPPYGREMHKMDKYEFNLRIDQIKKKIASEDFETAMKIADTIDWRRVPQYQYPVYGFWGL